MQQQATN